MEFDVITARAFMKVEKLFEFIDKIQVKGKFYWLFLKKEKLNKNFLFQEKIYYIYKNKSYLQALIKLYI